MSALSLDSQKGILAIARGAIEQDPDLTLDELATSLARGLGIKRPEARQVLLDSGLFASTTPIAAAIGDSAAEPTPGPRFAALADLHGREIGVYDRQPPADSTLVPGPDGTRLVLPIRNFRVAQAIADGLNRGLPYIDAVHRGGAIESLLHGWRGGTVRYAGPLDHSRAFVCDLTDKTRSWGPFPSAEAADAWRATDPALDVWAVTTPWPYSRYFPPALYGLFREENPLARKAASPLYVPPRPDAVSADDMTPAILAAARDYLRFQSESNRMYGPCRTAYEQLRALLEAGAAPMPPREKLYVNDLVSGRAWGPFASQVDAQAFLDSSMALRRSAVELDVEPKGGQLLPPASYHGRWPLWEPTEEGCDECSGTRWPTERHEEHCSLYEGNAAEESMQ